MSILHARQFSSWARGHLLCRVESTPGRFALSFDDGPSPRWTPRVLEVLARHGARATFFLLEPNIRRSGEVVRRMLSEGHEPALHGSRHWPVSVLPPWEIRAEVERCAEALSLVTGHRARFYRPPFGLMFPGQAKQIRSLGYEPVLGDVYPEDPQRPGTARIVRRVMRRLRAGSIVILHDGSPLGDPDRSQTVEALEAILAQAESEGLRAVTISELVGQS
ncbi:MAG TPA: polysaccharide deacetylase family protein [Candidatus Sulfotelmatobacter sp.]|nr:polysaccharide deacetylase family protein [Candidatus Sulfotelmatobacter sp.]